MNPSQVSQSAAYNYDSQLLSFHKLPYRGNTKRRLEKYLSGRFILNNRAWMDRHRGTMISRSNCVRRAQAIHVFCMCKFSPPITFLKHLLLTILEFLFLLNHYHIRQLSLNTHTQRTVSP